MLSAGIKKKVSGFSLDVSIKAESNEILALLGASGCGKSMTLQCIAGIQRPDSGRITLGSRVLFDSERRINLPPKKRRIGYMFQHYALFPNLTVLQNVAAGIKSEIHAKKNETAQYWIETVCASGLENKKPHELSGGERQRIALARLLASEPEAILLDEPFSALDDYLRWQLELELSEILHRLKLPSIVFVSHSRDEVYRLSNKVCVLDRGCSETIRSVGELFRNPETISAALISGCKNFSRAERIADGKIYALDWGVMLEVPNSISENIKYAGIRDHFVKPAGASDANVINCEVLRTIDDVLNTVVMLKTPGGNSGYSLLRAEMSKDIWASLDNPSALAVQLDPSDIMLLK